MFCLGTTVSLAPEPTPIRTTPTPIRTTPTGAKRPRVDDSVSEVQRNEDRVVPNGKEEPEPVPSKLSRVKVDVEENRRSSQKRVLVEAKVCQDETGGAVLTFPPSPVLQSDGGRGRDLRELLAERRGPRRPSGSAVDEEEEEGERVNVSSVVKLVERWGNVITVLQVQPFPAHIFKCIEVKIKKLV